jgi:hypothetical protein
MWLFGKGKKGVDKAKESTPAPVAKTGDKGQDIRAQALANARAARERIGEDTIQQIAAQLKKHEAKLVEQAKRQIKTLDEAHVADHVKALLDEKKKP